MPMRRAKGLALMVLTVFAGLAGVLLGYGSGPRASRGGKSPQPAFDAQAHLEGMNIPLPTRLRRGSVVGGLALVLLTAFGVYAGYEIKFERDARMRAIALTGGNPDVGRDFAKRYGCAGCHTIPGIPGAQGKVGPTLEGFAARVYIGGVITNSPDALIRWIEDPKSIDAKTAMPVTGISRTEARQVAAYLYSLR